MLVLSRRRDESVIINGNVRVVVVEIRGDKVRLGIEAPSDVNVYRSELVDRQREFDAVSEERRALGEIPEIDAENARLILTPNNSLEVPGEGKSRNDKKQSLNIAVDRKQVKRSTTSGKEKTIYDDSIVSSKCRR